MLEVEYLTDKNGQLQAVVIPTELWRQLLPQDNVSVEEVSEEIEDYCLNKAMDEAQGSRLVDRDEALKFLEE